MDKRIIALLTVIAVILCGCARGEVKTVDEDVALATEYSVKSADGGAATADRLASAPGGTESATAHGEGGKVSEIEQTEITAGTLTAGEWKDNDNFAFFKEVISRDEWKEYAAGWKLDLNNRFAVTVTDGQNAAKNVKVDVLDSKGNTLYSAVTDSYGKAYLYYGVSGSAEAPATVRVHAAGGDDRYTDGQITDEELKAGGKTVSASGQRYTKLDIMFTTDTTGSMSDELEYLKKELISVISQIGEDNAGLDIRASVNFYRDEGDDYVVRDFAFESDLEKVQKQLDEQFADGGGDTPEAVHTALENSVKEHEWREDAVKLLYLTLDAPGHKDQQGVPESVRESLTYAAANGIRVIPIAGSGVDKEAEFLLRASAAMAGGTYTFLTDDSGVGESHLEPTIGDYNVKKLNDLIIKITNEYCK